MQLQEIVDPFVELWDEEPEVIVQAPGRVNLIGEHTDYNGGFVLPVAVNRYIWVAASRTTNGRVYLYATRFGEEAAFPLDDIRFDAYKPWSNYIRGVAWSLQEAGFSLCGLKAFIKSNLPIGAGLSSSAALEVAIALAFQALSGFQADREHLAFLCQRAENEFVGMQCGIMDQFASLLARRGHALLLDCATLDYQHIPLPRNIAIVVADTRVKRELAGSEYNRRRRECEEAVRILQAHWGYVKSLRDVDPATMPGWERLLPEPFRRRAKHVITENERVLQAVEALRRCDVVEFGRLMNSSHASLRDDYQVSCPELDLLVETAQAAEGVYGSRLTGAGFGGCTVTLVQEEHVEALKARLKEAYRSRFGFEPDVYELKAVDGARIVANQLRL